MHKAITICRVCGNPFLAGVVDLGNLALTGVFPKSGDAEVNSAPLALVKCHGKEGGAHCNLVQLKHTYDLGEMYSDNYGYRSGLNQTMVRHLHEKVAAIRKLVALDAEDVIIDIGSNDATTLKAYPQGPYRLIGVDPTGNKFKAYYPDTVQLIADFFSAEAVKKRIGSKKAKVITSFSMFYDLEDPVRFAAEIAELLSPDGVWVLEQSYMPEMLKKNSFDTICHEHLEYYGLKQIEWITEKVGLKILDVEFNDINGGSFSVVVARKESAMRPRQEKIAGILQDEERQGLHTLIPYERFGQRIMAIRDQLRQRIAAIIAEGKTIYGIGASTKGNVILQYCGLSAAMLPYIGEVNQEKWGAYTPGSRIPIISERELLEKKPDYLLVLPWHFKEFFMKSPAFAGIKLLFPLNA